MENVVQIRLLGTTFNYNGTFNKAKSKQVLQTKKATFSSMTKIKQLNLILETSVELFERLIAKKCLIM